MNANNSTLGTSEMGFDRQKLLTIAEEILRESGLEYDHETGFDIRRESSSNNSIWIISFKTSPNPFGFDCETYFLELSPQGGFLDILTPRGRISKINNSKMPTKNHSLIGY